MHIFLQTIIPLRKSSKTQQFFQMNKKSAKYHLAISYAKHPLIIHPKQCNYLILNDMKNILNCKQDMSNIFNDNFQMRVRKLQIERERNYEIVGYKQIQDINLRVQRKKRLIQSQTKQQNTTIPSTSSIKSNQKFLTKNQVIDQYTPIQMTKRSHNSPLNMTNEKRKPNKRHKAQLTQQFSMSKLKHRMNQYKESWQHQIQRKKNIVAKNSKIPSNKAVSIIQGTDHHRTISLKRENMENKQNRIKFVPSMWEKILRKDTFHLSSNKIARIVSSGIKSVGYDKYRKELLWLEEKHQNGFFFKKDQSLKPCYFTKNLN